MKAEIIKIESLDDERIAPFARLTEARLRAASEAAEGIFIAESPKVIKVALERGYIPLSLLCERKHIDGGAREIIEMCGEIPLFTGSRDILRSLTGYTLTRGVLCAMRRKPLPSVGDICSGKRRVAVLQSITDTTNIGAIFRSASAMGVDAIVLSHDTCDPLNRRAVRVSMGTVFTVPWTMADNPVEELRKEGYTTVALALRHDSMQLDDPRLKQEKHLALIFGTEGDGLPSRIIADADIVVKIPMHHGVDSLNVAAAAAVTFWELR